MLYSLLQAISAIALRWFYGRVDAEGVERIPASGPAILVVNHPNAMVDSMVVALVAPRRILFTGNAQLFRNPLMAAFLRAAGVVPLMRRKDAAALGVDPRATRNVAAFDALTDALARGNVFMIFPEGVTGDWPQLAPLKTGAARIALKARDAGVRGLKIVPVGLTFERKGAPRSRVFAQVGEPIAVDDWPGADADAAAKSLTAEIDKRLRAVTLNYESTDAAERDLALAAQMARLFRSAEAAPAVWQRASLADEVAIARRIDDAQAALGAASPEIRARATALLDRLTEYRAGLRERSLEPEDLEISVAVTSGAWFVLREVSVIAGAGPVAVWGWLNHIIPFNAARAVAMRSVDSGADPAMRTINFALALVTAAYVAQGAVVAWLAGWGWATAYVASLPIAADVNFRFRPRLARAIRRAHAYLRFRFDPALQQELTRELFELRAESVALEKELSTSSRTVPAS